MSDEKKDNILRRQITGLEFRAQDPDRRMVEFVASTNAVDSYGTVLPFDKWELSRYARNGVVGYQHDIYYSDDPDNVIGRGEAFIDGDGHMGQIQAQEPVKRRSRPREGQAGNDETGDQIIPDQRIQRL